MTAEYLVHKSGKVQPGDTVLVHAAAGGTGLLLCQWLAHRGAIVIGCVGDDDKRRLAEGHGCRHAIDYRREDVAARVADLTGGEGLAVVYDSIGRDTAEASVACLRPGGTLVLYGSSSGAVPQHVLAAAAEKSLAVVRPGLFQENATPAALQAARPCALRGAGERRGGCPYRPALCARRCGRGAPRHRSEAHHRPERSNSWIAPRCVERTGDMHYHGAANILSRGHGSYS